MLFLSIDSSLINIRSICIIKYIQIDFSLYKHFLKIQFFYRYFPKNQVSVRRMSKAKSKLDQ